jgi:hypothetical protein
MSNKKQTAVDWLLNDYVNKGLITIEAIEQAKEIEKEQNIDAYNQGRRNGQTNWGVGNDITAKQYYKETYEMEHSSKNSNATSKYKPNKQTHGR